MDDPYLYHKKKKTRSPFVNKKVPHGELSISPNGMEKGWSDNPKRQERSERGNERYRNLPLTHASSTVVAVLIRFVYMVFPYSLVHTHTHVDSQGGMEQET